MRSEELNVELVLRQAYQANPCRLRHGGKNVMTRLKMRRMWVMVGLRIREGMERK